MDTTTCVQALQVFPPDEFAIATQVQKHDYTLSTFDVLRQSDGPGHRKLFAV